MEQLLLWSHVCAIVIGPDTLWVSVYYSHGSSASAAFPFAPQPSPDVGLLGFTTFECWFPGPDSNGSTIVGTKGRQPELVTDTIHDIINEGTPYNSPFSAQSLGENTRAFLDACAGAIVDYLLLKAIFRSLLSSICQAFPIPFHRKIVWSFTIKLTLPLSEP